jgi:hypothetical protein
MIEEPMERDRTLADALADVAGEPVGGSGWTELRHAVNTRAAVELARRRQQRRRTRIVIPASLAAGIALFVVVSQAPDRNVAPSVQRALTGQVSIDDLLDANVSDGQFRALVSGAGDANDLLSIAAEETQK